MMNRNKTVLVIIDVQGNLARLMPEPDQLFKQIGLLIDGIRLLEIPILWMEQLPEKLGETVDEVKSHLFGINPISKDVFSCCGNKDFNNLLHQLNPENILLAGIETHICVYQTAIELLSQGYYVEVVSDATSSRFHKNKSIGLDKIVRKGGELTSVEMVLFEIQKQATGSRFKSLIKLLK